MAKKVSSSKNVKKVAKQPKAVSKRRVKAVEVMPKGYVEWLDALKERTYLR